MKTLRYWHKDRDTSDLEQEGPHGATQVWEPGAGLAGLGMTIRSAELFCSWFQYLAFHICLKNTFYKNSYKLNLV